MRLVSSAENSSLDWRAQYRYIEDIGDGRGYTAGIIGFCSGTGDMLTMVERYARERPEAELADFLPALREVRGSDSHRGLGSRFTRDWQRAADGDRAFRGAQDGERDRVYFDPAVERGKADGLGALGQFCYYDARVSTATATPRGTSASPPSAAAPWTPPGLLHEATTRRRTCTPSWTPGWPPSPRSPHTPTPHGSTPPSASSSARGTCASTRRWCGRCTGTRTGSRSEGWGMAVSGVDERRAARQLALIEEVLGAARQTRAELWLRGGWAPAGVAARLRQ